MEQLHPREIELGLARVQQVQARLELAALRFPVVMVGGTNGKGSTVAMIEATYHAAGYRVGGYTSPHLIDYNERVRVQTVPASDAALCAAFARVERARGDIPLTYFEFGTLAAVVLLCDAQVDVAILEVGLGGRLDAVNAWDADVAIITSIGIDHTDWLGPDRDSIAREKAGIFRAQRPAVCSDPEPPVSLAAEAAARGATLYQIGRDFGFTHAAGGWRWHHAERARAGLPYPAMRGDYQLFNASAAIMALELLADRLPVHQADIRAGLLNASLPGRFQTLPGVPVRVLDVAHNAQAAQALARTLRVQSVSGRTHAVVGMLKDKPIADVVRALAPLVDDWHVATLRTERGASGDELRQRLQEAGIAVPVTVYDDIIDAYSTACAQAGPADRVVAFGSFYTVGAILRAGAIG